MINPWQEKLSKAYPEICFDIRSGAYVPEGWQPTVEACLQDIESIHRENGSGMGPQVTQIKTKWGYLCIYVEYSKYASDYVREQTAKAIRTAKNKTEKICMICGEAGKPDGRRIHCTKHTNKKQQ